MEHGPRSVLHHKHKLFLKSLELISLFIRELFAPSNQIRSSGQVGQHHLRVYVQVREVLGQPTGKIVALLTIAEVFACQLLDVLSKLSHRAFALLVFWRLRFGWLLRLRFLFNRLWLSWRRPHHPTKLLHHFGEVRAVATSHHLLNRLHHVVHLFWVAQ